MDFDLKQHHSHLSTFMPAYGPAHHVHVICAGPLVSHGFAKLCAASHSQDALDMVLLLAPNICGRSSPLVTGLGIAEETRHLAVCGDASFRF